MDDRNVGLFSYRDHCGGFLSISSCEVSGRNPGLGIRPHLELVGAGHRLWPYVECILWRDNHLHDLRHHPAKKFVGRYMGRKLSAESASLRMTMEEVIEGEGGSGVCESEEAGAGG